MGLLFSRPATVEKRIYGGSEHLVPMLESPVSMKYGFSG